MHGTSRPRVRFDTERLALDMAAKGWENKDLAAAADVSEMTISRFLRGETQTVKTARKIALALGRSPRYYLLRDSAIPATEQVTS